MQKFSSEVKKLTNQQLLSQTKFLVQKERNTHIQVLHHLEEIDPVLSHGELLSILLEEALKKHDPIRKKVRKTMKKEIVTSAQKWEHKGTVKKLSRAIPTYLKKHIWERDGGKCAYVHPKTKRTCSSKHLLQIDHIKPFSLGGKSEAGNLRLLCAGHNQFRSEKTFGRRISYTPPV